MVQYRASSPRKERLGAQYRGSTASSFDLPYVMFDIYTRNRVVACGSATVCC
jgi:hypothetical protein